MLTAYSGTNTCHTEPRLACSEMNAYRPTSRVITVTRARQVSRLSQRRSRRTGGTVVEPGQGEGGEGQAHDHQAADQQVGQRRPRGSIGAVGLPVADPAALMRAASGGGTDLEAEDHGPDGEPGHWHFRHARDARLARPWTMPRMARPWSRRHPAETELGLPPAPAPRRLPRRARRRRGRHAAAGDHPPDLGAS